MLSYLRRLFSRPTTAPPAPVATPRRGLGPQALLSAMAGAITPDQYGHPQRPERGAFPELPAGVVPLPATIATDAALHAALPGEAPRMALDSYAPAWGFGQQGFGSGFWFPGYPYLAELTQISEYRAPCETISTEMTRKWFELQSKEGGDKAERISEIMARCDELKVRDLFRRAALLDCEFGRAQIYMNIGDANDVTRALPLDLDKDNAVPVGSLKSISCIEPYWSTPYSWNASFPEREDFYKPVSWYIMGRKTHTTRLLTFIGREVPDLLKPAYNFGGISMIQLGELTVNMWLRTRKAVNDLINNFSIPVLATNLQATLEEGDAPGNGLLTRLQTFTLTRNNQAIAAIQKDEEELAFAEATLASLDKLQAQSQEHMAAVWRIPLTKLTGITPSGLNASAEGEIQEWYDRIAAEQINLFEPQLVTLLKVIQLDLDGTIDDDLVIHWVSLDEPTAKELAEIRKSDADAGGAYIQNGVISPDEERERLQNDPLSGYENLTGGAPEPQVDPGMEAQLGHESDQADAEREHQAGEADKSREHDTQKAVLAAAAKPEPAVPIRAKTKG